MDENGRILGLRTDLLADQGAFYSRRAAHQIPRRSVPHRHRVPMTSGPRTWTAKGAYTNKAPGGVAYRCSFRVTEASYLIERLVQNAAYEIGMDPAEFRRMNFIQPEQFPYTSPTGFVYDSGDYETALQKAMDMIGYDELRAEQAAARARGTAGGNRDGQLHRSGGRRSGAHLRHRGVEDVRLGRASGPSHREGHPETGREDPRDRAMRPPSPRSSPRSWGFPPPTLRSCTATPTTRPTASAPTPPVPFRWEGRRPPWSPGKLRDKARKIAAHLLEASPEDLEMGTGKILGEGIAGRERDHPGHRLRGLHQPSRGRGSRAGRRSLLQPAQHDLSLRDLHRGGGHRHRHRGVEGAADGGGGRLRRAD